MDPTVTVAVIGIAATFLTAAMAAYLQYRSGRDIQIRAAKIAVYGECAANLYEYERLLYNRTRTRFEPTATTDREALRQETYKFKSRALAAIGKAEMLSDDQELTSQLHAIRTKIDELVNSEDHDDLKRRHSEIRLLLADAWPRARRDVRK